MPTMPRSSKVPFTRRCLYDAQASRQYRHDPTSDGSARYQNTHNGLAYDSDERTFLHRPPGRTDQEHDLSMDSNYNMDMERHKRGGAEDSVDLGIVRSRPLVPAADNKDIIPASVSFTFWDVVIYVFSIVTYLSDIGADIWVAYLYFSRGQMSWFIMTLVFILLPALTMTCFGLAWYIQDHKNTTDKDLHKVGHVWWTSRSLFLFLQIGPVIRYIECLIYGVRSKKERDWYMILVLEDTDAALLRLLECFMESAPQLVLQLYIMTVAGPEEGWILIVGQCVSCFTSLASVSWAIISYNRALRLSLENKANLTSGGMALQFVWSFFIVGSRVIALAMFATAHGYWVFVVLGSHWLVMFVWILIQNTHFCYTRCQEVFFNMVTAVIFVFCYFNLLEGHTRLRYVFYHILMYAENMAMMLVWYMVVGTTESWYITPAFTAVLGGFFIGIFFQIVYYMACHPNNLEKGYEHKKIRLCVPWRQLYLCRSPPEEQGEEVAPEHEQLQQESVDKKELHKLKPIPPKNPPRSESKQTKRKLQKETPEKPLLVHESIAKPYGKENGDSKVPIEYV